MHNNEALHSLGCVPCADAQEEEVRRHLEACGDIANVRLVRDSATGLGKGFGFVLFEVCCEDILLFLSRVGVC